MLHKTQQFFRQLLDGFSQPATPVCITIEDIQPDKNINIQTIIFQTLFDAEVSFFATDEEKKQEIEQRYRSKSVALSEADFIIFSLKDVETLVTVLEDAKKGDLVDPQNSSTWIIAIPSLLDGDLDLLLEGPGIKDTKVVALPQELKTIWKIREKLNQEYPLGVDIIVVDENNYFSCIPRTTRVKELEK